MPITEILARNAKLYGNELALTEINLDLQDRHNVIWREYELIENNPAGEDRVSMTWRVFDEKANRMANLLLKRGIKKGQKVVILLMNASNGCNLFWDIESRRGGRAAEFPLYGRGDQILPEPVGYRGTDLRSRIHRTP